MTLKLKNLADALHKIPEVPHELHVSAHIWELMMAKLPEPIIPSTLAFNEVPVVLETHYHPSWWSEHYADTIILHTEKGSVTIPGVKLRHAIRPLITTFEIKEPE